MVMCAFPSCTLLWMIHRVESYPQRGGTLHKMSGDTVLFNYLIIVAPAKWWEILDSN